MQEVAPAEGPVLVRAPAEQTTQAEAEDKPVAGARTALSLPPISLLPLVLLVVLWEVGSYNPAAHAVQDTTAEIAEYWPRGHMLHKVAPALTPVSVTEPAGHTVQLVAPGAA